jgi:hypothetical protein
MNGKGCGKKLSKEEDEGLDSCERMFLRVICCVNQAFIRCTIISTCATYFVSFHSPLGLQVKRRHEISTRLSATTFCLSFVVDVLMGLRGLMLAMPDRTENGTSEGAFANLDVIPVSMCNCSFHDGWDRCTARVLIETRYDCEFSNARTFPFSPITSGVIM